MQSYKSEGFDKGREQQQLAKLGSFTALRVHLWVKTKDNAVILSNVSLDGERIDSSRSRCELVQTLIFFTPIPLR